MSDPMRPWLYRLVVRFIAFAMRHGITSGDVEQAARSAWPDRGDAWRVQIVADARARNAGRMASR